MLKNISISIDLICPNCNTLARHNHSLEFKSTIDKYNKGELTAIGHSNRLYENSMNFNCPTCKCWHSVYLEPIEVHVHPEVTDVGFIEIEDFK